MAYSEHLYVAGETVTAANLNASTYYNGRYFKGKDGAVIIEDQLVSRAAGAVTDTAFAANITGDSNFRFKVTRDGKIWWGPGNAGQDTNLYRDAADRLRTDDDLVVAGKWVVRTANTQRLHIQRGTKAVAHGSPQAIDFSPAFGSTPVVVLGENGSHGDGHNYISALSASQMTITNPVNGTTRTTYWLAIGVD